MYEPIDPSKSTLWILTEVYYPEEISTGYYLTKIAEGLSKQMQVAVLTGQPKHMARGLKAERFELRNGVAVHRVWATTLDKNIFLFRLLNMLTIGISMFIATLRLVRKSDRILVVTAPPSLPITTTVAAIIKSATVSLLVQDSYPEILVALARSKPSSLIVKTTHFVNRWVYKYLSHIIVMGRDMNELFRRKTRSLDVPITTIPNWADLESLSPGPREENILLEELGLKAKFVFLYAGNIGHPTDVETIISSAAFLKRRSDIHFLFIGAGAKKAWLDDQVNTLDLSNVTVLDYRPRDQQNVFLNACDVGLVALKNGMWGTAMPSRTYNIMAVGKPILALTDEGSELAQVIDEERIGWHLTPGDPGRLSAAIEEILDSRHLLQEMGDRARAAAEAKYSQASAVAKYAAVLTAGSGV
jgi:colanic acid biosynthesis glycosyl transferase WcaI